MKNTTFVFFVKILCLSAPILILLILYVAFDPFKVIYSYSSYYKSGEPSYVTLNRDYVSTQTFIQNYPKIKYDSFIFGNSRSIFYEVKDWTKHLQDGRCYHFDASGETLFGINKKIRYLSKKHIRIKNALLILDCGTLQTASESKGHLFLIHPALRDDNFLSFQFEYIKTFFDINFLLSYLPFKFFGIKSQSLDDRPFDYNSESNEIKFTFFENMICENPNNYYLPRKSFFYKRDNIQTYSPVVIKDQQKEMLLELAILLKRSNSNFKIIINPLYDQQKLNAADLGILKTIFGENNVFDYSGINEITSNMYNYYENSHYRPHIARKIMEEIYNN
jgi:hypothetical protein